MTSATGSPGRRRGAFSLLEVLIAVGIIALFSGVFLLRFGGTGVEEALASASGELQTAALQAKRRAYAYRRDEAVFFDRGSFASGPAPPPGAVGFESPDPWSAQERFHLPAGVSMELRAPGESEWRRPERHVWRFRASGLNDPLEVRFSMENSHATLHFNALSGRADLRTILE